MSQPLPKVGLKPFKVSDTRVRLGQLGREPLSGFALASGLGAQIINLPFQPVYFGK